MEMKPLNITPDGTPKPQESSSFIVQPAPLLVLTLRRLTKHHPDGTFSVIFLEDETPLCCVVEPPANCPGRYLTPPGEYLCKQVPATERFPYPHYEVTGVKDHTGILFHRGNTMDDTEGCLLIVTGPDPMNSRHKLAGKFSSDAFSIFMAHLMGHKEFKLVIV